MQRRFLADPEALLGTVVRLFAAEEKVKEVAILTYSTPEVVETKEESLDTTIMELADDIAYGVHDLEDAIALRLITREKWLETQGKFDSHWVNERELQDIENQLFGESW